jgi:hypothetical protein
MLKATITTEEIGRIPSGLPSVTEWAVSQLRQAAPYRTGLTRRSIAARRLAPDSYSVGPTTIRGQTYPQIVAAKTGWLQRKATQITPAIVHRYTDELNRWAATQ